MVSLLAGFCQTRACVFLRKKKLLWSAITQLKQPSTSPKEIISKTLLTLSLI